jgi:hypothetical protein
VWSIASHRDVQADHELVKQIGTKRGWKVFLGTHSTGFDAELPRAQIEAMNYQPVDPVAPKSERKVGTPFEIPRRAGPTALPSQQAAPSREGASTETIEWDS